MGLKSGKTIELIKGNIKVSFINLGEGISGDFNPKDKEDTNLLRFDVYKKSGKDWEPVEDASYCTAVPAKTKDKTLRKLLKILMREVFYSAISGDSIKKRCERLSWINPTWANKLNGGLKP